MTEHTTRDGRRDDEHRERDRHRPTLGDLTHTNPQTGESFGDAMVYHRGPTVAADGGTERPDESEADQDADDETLSDVEHTPPRDAEDANNVHERGGEHTDEGGEGDEGV